MIFCICYSCEIEVVIWLRLLGLDRLSHRDMMGLVDRLVTIQHLLGVLHILVYNRTHHLYVSIIALIKLVNAALFYDFENEVTASMQH